MSPVLDEAQLRADWAPKCEHVERDHIVDAWLAEDAVMHAHGYAPRQGETFAANCRATTGATSPSLHSFFGKNFWKTWTGVVVQTAVATDFNSTSNPYGTKLVTDMPRAMVDDILAIRTNNGVPVFHWGGYFSGHKDGMHWQLCCSHADLATGIDPSTVKGHNPQGDAFMAQLTDDEQHELLGLVREMDKVIAKSGYIEKLVNLEQDDATKLAALIQGLKDDPTHGAGPGDIDPAEVITALRDALTKGLGK